MSNELASVLHDPILEGVPLTAPLSGPPAPGPGMRYQLGELSAARNPLDPHHSLPDLHGAARVLDIGCGIGSLLSWSPQSPGVERVGIDIDTDSLRYGHRYLHGTVYLLARAEALPFRDSSFDYVTSRVTLPYTELARATTEVARVLEPGGHVWFTCHSLGFVLRQWRAAVRAGRMRDALFRTYVLASGLSLHVFGRTLSLPGRSRHESFQTASGMRRLLTRHGFADVKVTTTRTGSLCIRARRR